jgi:predicted MFS family arabinose efflux permease
MEHKKLPKGILSIQFLVLFSYSSLAVLTLLPLFFAHLGGSPRKIGFLVGLFSLAAFLSRPFAGWILSRFDSHRILLLGLLVITLTTVSYFFIQSLNWAIFLVRIVHGVGFSFFILAALLIAIFLVPAERRAYAIGVVSTGFMIPLLFLPYLGEQIIEKQGFFLFFLTASFLTLIPLVYAMCIKFKPALQQQETALKGAGFLRLFRRQRIFLIYMLTFVFEVGLSASFSFVPLLAHRRSPMKAGYFFTALGTTAVVMRLYGGRKLKFWGRPGLLIPAFGFLVAGECLVYFSQTNFLLGFTGFIWGLGIGVLYPHLTAMMVEGVSVPEKAKVLGLFASSVDLGFAVGPIAFGWVSQSIGLRNTFLVFAGLILVSASVLLSAGRRSLFHRIQEEG